MELTLGQGGETRAQLVVAAFVTELWQGVVLAVGVGLCLRLVPRTTALRKSEGRPALDRK